MNDFFSVENDVLFHIFILLWLFWILKPETLWFYHINYSALDVTLLIVSLDSRKYEHVIWSYPRRKYCKYLQPVLTKITEKERRVQLRISFRYLLMNLKDNYLLKRLLKLKANTLLTIRKNFSLKNETSTCRDVITLHVLTKNGDHMMYGSWYMDWNRQISLSFWDIFCSFTPSLSSRLTIKKIKKNPNNTILLSFCACVL